MKIRITKIAFLALFITFGLVRNSKAQNTAGQVGSAITTGVPFLTISPDSRHGALGDAGVAISDNSNAMHWNPAGLAFAKKDFGVSLSYTPWLRTLIPDISLSYLSAYKKLPNDGGTIGGSLRFFSLGKIEFTDDNGISQGEFTANEFALDAGYAQKVTENFAAAIALRFIYSNLASNATAGGQAIKPGTSFAGDIGLRYSKDVDAGATGMNISWGINISNIGSKISYTNETVKDFLPTNLRAGWALTFFLDDYNKLTLTNDFNKLLVPSPDSTGEARKEGVLGGMFGSFGDAQGGFGEELTEFTTSIAMEYWYNDLFAARAGFFYEDPNKGNRKYITFGAGLKYKTLNIDFAYLSPLTLNHPLKSTLRFTLGLEIE